MKKLSTFVCMMATFICGSISAETKTEEPCQHYPYVTLGLGPAPLPLPVFGAGYRSQWAHHGVNGAVNVATVYYATGVKGSLLYNYYPKPNLHSQFYFGVGPAVSAGYSKHSKTGFGFASEFAFGKQYRNETGDLRFFEATVDFPCALNEKNGLKFYPVPIVIFNYGLGF